MINSYIAAGYISASKIANSTISSTALYNSTYAYACPVSDSTKKKRLVWIDHINSAMKYGLPKTVCEGLSKTVKEIQRSIDFGGSALKLEKIEEQKAKLEDLRSAMLDLREILSRQHRMPHDDFVTEMSSTVLSICSSSYIMKDE